MTDGSGIRAGLLDVAVTVKVCDSPPPAVMPDEVDRLRSGVLKDRGRVRNGVECRISLTAVTVTVKVRLKVLTPPLAVPPLSVTVTVIVAVPMVGRGREGERAGRIGARVGAAVTVIATESVSLFAPPVPENPWPFVVIERLAAPLKFGVGAKPSPFSRPLIAAIVPVNVMLASLVPSPTLKVRPVVPLSVMVPFDPERVT